MNQIWLRESFRKSPNDGAGLNVEMILLRNQTQTLLNYWHFTEGAETKILRATNPASEMKYTEKSS